MAKWLSKEKKRALSLKLLPPVFNFLTKLLIATCEKEFYFPSEKPKPPFIVALWHEYILLSPYIFRKLMGDGAKVSVIISEHFDGKIIAKVNSYYDVGYIQGSSTRGGVKALKESFKLIDSSSCVAITPDGPRGPRRSVADGIVGIAQKKDVPIVAFSFSASSYWRLKSWDKFLIPKPFSTIMIKVSEPFFVSDLDKEKAKELIKQRLSDVV